MPKPEMGRTPFYKRTKIRKKKKNDRTKRLIMNIVHRKIKHKKKAEKNNAEKSNKKKKLNIATCGVKETHQ